MENGLSLATHLPSPRPPNSNDTKFETGNKIVIEGSERAGDDTPKLLRF